MKEQFNEDYYERGIEKGVSGYTNYSYMPTRSYEEASSFSNIVYGKVLDYGCAKGYLVHALRQLGVDAWGFDISDYAVENAHPPVKEYINNPNQPKLFDFIICKDVMEHVPEEQIPLVLKDMQNKLSVLGEIIFVIPLGDNNIFRIREYELDVTHVTKKDEDWWINTFRENGFKTLDFKYKLGDVKKKWQGNDYGNGIFTVCMTKQTAEEIEKRVQDYINRLECEDNEDSDTDTL